MTLSAGTRLGPYEILSPLGAGGMGEVYRARDTRLGREVAVKVLPEHVSQSADARSRFEREAQAASSLNHPNIITVHDVGFSADIAYVAMELVEGSSLRDVLGSTRVPASRTLEIGRQIADGLARAHAAGIVHRDLKPENVMISKDGFAKILDFGLAKVARSSPSVTNAPTVPATEPGTIMGTVGYMSPEQASARTVDYRSDQFSLGVMLYEMSAGKRPFERSTQAQTLASIIEDDPEPISQASPGTPAALRWAIERCLQKDPEERYASTKDLARDLKSIRDHLSEASVSAQVPAARSRLFGRPIRWMAAASLVGAAVAAALFLLFGRGRDSPRPVRFQILSSRGSPFQDSSPAFDIPSSPTLSPDGRAIAFAAVCPDGKDRLWVHALDAIGSQARAGTEGASYPFWSPDSQSIGFFADGKLKRMPVSGGPAQILCDAKGRGGTWGRDGTILFGANGVGISRVPSSGGAPTPVTKLDSSRRESSHRWPQFLPDGRHFLYFSYLAAGVGDQNGGLFVGSLGSTEKKLLFTAASNAVYAPPGYLLTYRDGNLVAQPFDAKRLELSGEPRPVAELVSIDPAKKFASFSASDTGILAYAGGLPSVTSRLIWFDRSGREVGSAGEPGFISDVRLSRDGSRAAYSASDPQTGAGSIWICDLARNSVTRFAGETTGDRGDYEPVWSPDARSIAFSAARTGAPQLYRKSVDGTEGEIALTTPMSNQEANDWSPDGRLILYSGATVTENSSLWAIAAEGGRKPNVVVAGASGGRLSPSGDYIAYTTDESGKPEVYAAPFPGAAPRVKISSAGGIEPCWRRDGKELYYLSPDDDLMAADVKLGPVLEAGVPRKLFHARPARLLTEYSSYDAAPDGTRFLVNSLLGERMPAPFTVVLNWASELKKMNLDF